MEKVNTQLFMRCLIVALLAVTFSCFTLWLIDSWIKYPLFLFEITTIIILFLIVNNYDIKIFVKKQVKLENMLNGTIIDLTLVFSSLTLLVVNGFQASMGLIKLILSILCTSLLSGYAFLNVLEIRQYFSTLEAVVLSHITSYILTAFVTLAAILLPEVTRTPFILSVFIGLGIASMLKHRKSKPYQIRKSLVKSIDALAIALALAFYALSFYFMYPSFALLPGTDISRHYAQSVVLWRTPDLYVGSVNLLAHLHESTLIQLSNSPIEVIQTGLVALNLMLPLAFYVMAKVCLEKIDTRLPSLATLFWVLFTSCYGGFAWLYFTMLKLSTVGQTQLQLLITTADKTYNGTIYGILGLWYVPVTIAFTQLMVAILLLYRRDIPTSKYVTTFSILIASLYLTHVVEATIFASFLAIYGGIAKNKSLRINDALKSVIIGFLLVTLVYYIFSHITPRFIINTSLLISIIGPILASLSSLLFRSYIRLRLALSQKAFKTSKKSFGKTLVLVLLFVYIVAFLSWTSLVDSFHTWQVDIVGFVPWFMYPLMLGVNGLLAIPALYYIIEDTRSYTTLRIFIAFMIFAAVIGRIISIINMNFFEIGYWEKRFVTFIKLSLAMLAPITVIRLIDKLRKRKMHANLKAVISVIVIGVIILSGISTTFLNVEYWNIVINNSANWPSSSEMEAIKVFKEILNNDPKAWLITITRRSSDTVAFAAPADRLVLRQSLYTAYRPEMAFVALYRHPAYSHPYIYLHTRDLTQLSKFTDRFLYKYISMLPLVYENSEVKIYNVSKLSPPQPNSDNVLIIPLDKSLLDEQSLYIAYIILSQHLYNYTVAYDLDDKALDAKNVILSYDPPHKYSLNFRPIEDYVEFLKSGGKVIVLNMNGYNFFGNDLFLFGNSTFNAERVKGTKAIYDLPVQLITPKLVLKKSSITVLSQYIGSNDECPFIVKQSYGEGELYYVNIYPIVKTMYNTGSWSMFYDVLGKLLEDLNLSKVEQIVPSFDGCVREIYLSDGSKVETTSLVFPLKIFIRQLNIQTKNGIITFTNVTRVNIKNYSKLFIEAENFTISNGHGFYAVAELNSPFLVESSADPFVLEIAAEDGVHRIIRARRFSIVPYNSILLLVRTPNISANKVVFVEFYPQGFLRWKTRAYSQNLRVVGLTSFQIHLSDSYTILKNVKLGNRLTHDPPIVMFDESSTLPTAVFWILLLLPIFLGAIFIYSKQSSPNC